MLKKLLGSLATSENEGKNRQNGVHGANAPQLNESDYEFLFLQLLEGLAHGWQQPRIISFFEDIEDRISKQQWLDWLDGFGAKMLASAAPDHNLAARMVQLGEMKCGEIGDRAYDIGMKVLTRGQQPVYVDFNADDLGVADADLFEFAGADLLSSGLSDAEITELNESDSSEVSIFEFAGPDAADRTSSTPASDSNSDFADGEAEDAESDVREVTLEEFMAILQQDPELAKGIGQELGLDSSDPQLIIQALIAQAQSEEPKI